MASAKPGVHVVQLKPIKVPESLYKGSKFLMWNENTQNSTPVTLKVDEKGYILFWKDQNKEMDFLDISLIRDTRTGKYARVPKDLKLRESLMIGQQDVSLEDKTVSVCYGTDMVNIEWLNFVCANKETAVLWADELLKYSVNLLSINSSALSFLEKWYIRSISVLGTDNKIPIKNIIKQVASHRDDKKRVEKALEAAGLMGPKSETVDSSKLTFENFFNFYHNLVGRQEVDVIFADIGAKKKPYLTAEQFMEFLNKEQRDSRLNEILYPFYKVRQAQDLISVYETKAGMAQKGHLSSEGLLKFLMSEDNSLIPGEKLDLSEDMNQPLAHYFINSSHNTYLTGHQFTGKSSVEIYRQVLLSGCRCIELDCWDGKGADEEPMITHGYTMCTEVPFKDVIEAIAESAFKTSDYPVILSFENHCGPRQQAKMANYCRSVFGSMLLDAPLDSHPLKPDVPLPSPELLKRRIIIKNKKKHFHKGGHMPKTPTSTKAPKMDATTKPKSSVEVDETGGSGGITDQGSGTSSPTRKISATETSPTHAILEKNMSVCSEGEKPEEVFDSDSESSDSDDDEAITEEISEEEKQKRLRVKRDKGTAGQEAEAALEMSALVNYIQPIHFHSFEASEKRRRSYEISSFVETQGTSYLKEFPVDFVNYNKRQLSRIYPRGTRVDSSNFMPQVFWNAGCQLVALNFQTLDLAMQLNLGIFEYNGRSGYILKPNFMRRNDRHFDPFAESTVDGIVAGTLTIKVISGQFLSDKRVGTYVEVDMYGLPTDTVRKKFRTRTIPSNGLNPVYAEEPFVFKKVVLPNLATIRLGVFEETGKLIGHRILPVEGLRPGFRHIPLRNECNQPLMLPTIFVHIIIGDYIPDELAKFTEALSNPIAYISNLEQRAQQLEILTEDFESDLQDDVADSEEDMDDEDTVTPLKDPKEKTNQRQNSLNRSMRVDMSPTTEPKPPLTRVPSQHPVVSKQESNTSSGSVPANSSQMTRMSSTYMGDSNYTYSVNSKLNDPNILTPTPVDELKTYKAFQKVEAKRDKELEIMRRKHEKALESLKEQQLAQLDKLIASQTRARIALEKKHTKSLKKIAKSGENVEEKQQVFKGELQEMLQVQDQQHRELKYRHAQMYVAMNRDHFQAEKDLYLRYHEPIYEALFSVMATNHECHKKALDDIHSYDVVELKKTMDPQIRETMKMLAKKHKDKQELSRIKREAQQKHVGAVVAERQRLSDMLQKRKDDLQQKHETIRKEVEKDKEKMYKHYTEEYEKKCERLQNFFKAEIQTLGIEEDEDEDGGTGVGKDSLTNGSTVNYPSTVLDNGMGSCLSTSLGNGDSSSMLEKFEDDLKDEKDENGCDEDEDGDVRKVNSKEELTCM